jgi:hypothetical protein
MKWSLTHRSSIFFSVGPVIHSLQSVHDLGLATTALFVSAYRKKQCIYVKLHIATKLNSYNPSKGFLVQPLTNYSSEVTFTFSL